MKGDENMAEMKAIFCCGSTENLCEDISCKVEETDKGFCFSVTSDDPEKIKMLKEKIKSCCSPTDSKSCC
jgi:hypothetical protein